MQNTVLNGQEKVLKAFYDSTGMNLDRFQDIQRLLGAGLATQSHNRNNPKVGDPNFIISDFSTLFSCNDPGHKKRLLEFVDSEMDANLKARDNTRSMQKHGSKPANMAKKYNL